MRQPLLHCPLSGSDFTCRPAAHLRSPRLLPVGANGTLGSSSDRSALIRLLSDDARHCVRAGRLSTLPPRDSGRALSGSPCTGQKRIEGFFTLFNANCHNKNKNVKLTKYHENDHEITLLIVTQVLMLSGGSKVLPYGAAEC